MPTYRATAAMRSGGCLIKVFLEAAEHLVNFIRLAKIGDGIGNRIVILEAQQRSQLGRVDAASARSMARSW